MAKYCKQCGERMNDNAKFCGMCRAPFEMETGNPGKPDRLKKAGKILILAVILIMMISFITKCAGGGSIESKLVGSWYFEKNDSFAFTLYDDGTCEIDGEYGSGTWTVVNDSKLKLTNFYGQSDASEIDKISGNTLVLGSGEKTQTFVKKG